MKAWVFCISMLLPIALAAATDKRIAKAQKIMSDRTRDPSSVQFRNMRYIPEKHSVCGSYNAKNGFGGYIGFRRFAVDDAGHVYELEDLPTQRAIRAMSSEELAALKIRLAAARENAKVMFDTCGDAPA